MVIYIESAAEIEASQLRGFFEGWPHPPSPETHLRILRESAHVVIALTNEPTQNEPTQVVGFVTAISDGVLSAYISLLEVVPSHRGQGIGTELVRRMLSRLGGLYSINLHCDPQLQPFYESLGMQRLEGMAIRNHP